MFEQKFTGKIAILAALLALTLLAGCDDSRRELFHFPGNGLKVSSLATELGFSKDRPLVMGMNTSYTPLQYVDDKGVPCGYDVEFTKILMQRMGIPYTFSPNHWDKMSPGIIEGKYDIGLLVYSEYRKELTNYSNAVFRMYYQIVFRKKDYTDFDFRHLRGKKIAYMKSRPIGLMLKNEGAYDVPVTDLEESFNDLVNGKYDGVICYRFQSQYNIRKMHLENEVEAEDLSLQPREYCYASHDKRLIDAVNAELKKMEAEGIIDDVYGDNVLSQFGTIRIPLWVWVMLAVLVIVFLTVFSVNRYRYSKKLQQAHQQLETAYCQLAENNVQLTIANRRAEESIRMKSSFIKQMSHEIRTPLNILSGFAQILATSGIQLSEQERSDASEQIMVNTNRITGLVNKMLELADISSQSVLERADKVSPAEIARIAVESTDIEHQSHLAFSLQLHDGADELFATDRRAATRIVELLLDNAIKFTREANAAATVPADGQKQASMTVSADDSTVRFIVEDTGIGVPEKDAEHIFEEFVQLDEYYNGTGIGLTVARSLARRLGGDVVLDTHCTDRTRFVVTLAK